MTAPRSLSQPPASFIASWHLGIHRTPLVAYLPQSLVYAPLPSEASKLETKAQTPALRSRPGKTHFIRLIRRHPPASPRLAPLGGLRSYWESSAFCENFITQQKLQLTLRMHLSKNASRYCIGKTCGADRDRTDDIQLAKLALSQLSYSPSRPSYYRKPRRKPCWRLTTWPSPWRGESGGPRWT